MQSVISPVDHESRYNNSIRIETEPTERTPLITTDQVVRSIMDSRNPATVAVVVMLFIILIIGVFISIYLLIHQGSRLPPIDHPSLEDPDHPKSQWDGRGCNDSKSLDEIKIIPPASHIIAVETATDTCYTSEECKNLLNKMQEERNALFGSLELPYNFLVSSNGQTYEELGWRRPSPLIPEYSNSSLVLAFIGNFSTNWPSKIQVDEAGRLFDESISRGALKPNYTIIGKYLNTKPINLFKRLIDMSQWNTALSDC